MDIYDLGSEALYAGPYIPSFQGYYYRWFPLEYTMEAHRHKQAEIMYVEQGACFIEVRGQSLSMGKGEFILLNGEVDHRLLVEQGMNCRILNIEFVFVQDVSFYSFGGFCAKAFPEARSLLAPACGYHLLRDSGDIHELLKQMVRAQDAQGGGTEITLHLLFWQLMLKLRASLLSERLAAQNPQAAYAEQAIRMMKRQYYKPMDVETIADALSINRSHFHRIFKEYTGITPIRYLTGLRIERAKNLLIKTKLPMTEIARNVGLHSQQYFTYLFKKETGLSPLQYKKTLEIDPIPDRLIR